MQLHSMPFYKFLLQPYCFLSLVLPTCLAVFWEIFLGSLKHNKVVKFCLWPGCFWINLLCKKNKNKMFLTSLKGCKWNKTQTNKTVWLRPYVASKESLKYLLSSYLQKKFANPWFTVKGWWSGERWVYLL